MLSNLPGLLNVALCTVIVLTLFFYRRRDSRHKPLMSWLAWRNRHRQQPAESVLALPQSENSARTNQVIIILTCGEGWVKSLQPWLSGTAA
ncbi:phage holin family protein [Escherichia coli]|uniref:phage holin family protein n=1 Tax=Escherichia coli TaxID=562 RepID=UPI00313F0120